MRRVLVVGAAGAALILGLVGVTGQPAAASAADGPPWGWMGSVMGPAPAAAPHTIRSAGSPSGVTVVVWADAGSNGDAWASVRQPHGDWVPIQLSSYGRGIGPAVAVAADGSALAMWSEFDGENYRPRARLLSAAGVWDSPTDLAEPGENAGGFAIAARPDGEFLAAWLSQDGDALRTRVASRSRASGWSATSTLSAAMVTANSPAVAVDSTGVATLAWTETAAATGTVVQAARALPGQPFGAPVRISGPDADAVTPQVSAEAVGHATVGWLAHPSFSASSLHAASYVSGRWTAPVRLGIDGAGSPSMEFALTGAAGRAYAMWTVLEPVGNRHRIMAAERGSSWSAAKAISDVNVDSTAPSLAALSSGQLIAAWDRSADSRHRVTIANRAPGQTWSAPRIVGDPQVPETYPQATLAVETATVVSGMGGVVQSQSTEYVLPMPVSEPVLSSPVRVGATVSCRSTWILAVSTSTTWLRDDRVVAHGASYVPTAKDRRRQLACRVVASNSSGKFTAAANSVHVGKGLAPTPARAPKIKGKAQVGARLKVTKGRWDPADTTSRYTWTRGGTTVATGRKYRPTTADRGRRLVVMIHSTAPGHRAGDLTIKTKRVR